jgi:hypothetical protein
MKDGEGDLGGIEELAASFPGNGIDEDAVGGAGDEVADAVVPFEQRHGAPEGLGGLIGSDVFIVMFFHVGVEGASPRSVAAPDSDFGAGGPGGGTGFERRGWALAEERVHEAEGLFG